MVVGTGHRVHPAPEGWARQGHRSESQENGWGSWEAQPSYVDWASPARVGEVWLKRVLMETKSLRQQNNSGPHLPVGGDAPHPLTPSPTQQSCSQGGWNWGRQRLMWACQSTSGSSSREGGLSCSWMMPNVLLCDLHGDFLCLGHSPSSDFSQQPSEASSPVQSTKFQCLYKNLCFPPTRALPAQTESWDRLPLQASSPPLDSFMVGAGVTGNSSSPGASRNPVLVPK